MRLCARSAWAATAAPSRSAPWRWPAGRARSVSALRAYTVVAPPLPMWPATAAEPVQPEVDAAARQRERARLGAALDGIGEREVGYPVVGDPATELTRRSGHLDLLVLGSRSHGPLRRLILGSTSRHLVRHAACPVLVLPRGARAPAALDTAVAQ
jgi:nucleotide-binding universal stress UspA family protein